MGGSAGSVQGFRPRRPCVATLLLTTLWSGAAAADGPDLLSKPFSLSLGTYLLDTDTTLSLDASSDRTGTKFNWEGVLGGLAAAMAVAAIGAMWFNVRRVAFLALCMAVVLISIVGDLTESMFKRYAGLKDSGSVFPGHGGVLDRIDSITAAAPTFLLGLGWMESQP